MDTNIQEFIDILNNVDTEQSRLQTLAQSMQCSTIPQLSFNGKVCVKDTTSNLWIKIDTAVEGLRRLQLYYKAVQAGISQIFLPETVLLQTDNFIATSQEDILVWGEEYQEKYRPEKLLYNNQLALSCKLNENYPELYEDIWEFFEEYQLQGIHGDNAGYDENYKLKIFDWFGNYWIDSHGEIIKTGR